MIHRDIKPSNLMLQRDGALRILDFGLARLEGEQSLTMTGDFIGTVLYVSPEQAMARRVPLDHRTDIYSLGATMYEMLTWRPPFSGKSAQDTLNQIIFRDPEQPRQFAPRVSRDLETIVLKCLRKDPRDRYATAEALAQDLRRFARGEAIEARPQPKLEKLARKMWRHRGKLAAAASIIVLLVTTALFAWWSSDQEHQRKVAEYGPAVNEQVLRMQLGTLPEAAALAIPLSTNTHPIDRMQMAGALFGGAAVEGAVRELGAIAESLPERPEAYYHRARGLHLLHRDDEALRELERAILCDASFVPALILKAIILEQRGVGEAAHALREQATELGGEAWGEIWLAAQKAQDERRWKAAADAYGELIECETGGRPPYVGLSAVIRLGRGRALLKAGDFDGALLAFAAAQDRWPQAIQPALFLGKTYYLDGKKTLADETFGRLFAKSPFSDEVALAVAALYRGLGEYQKALDWVKRVSVLSVRERSKVLILPKLGRWAEAVQAGKRACELDSGDARARKHLGGLYVTLGRYEEGVALLKEAVALEPSDPETPFELVRYLGFFGKLQEALQRGEEAIATHPTVAGLHVAMGLVLSWLGQTDRAAQMFKEAVALEPWCETRALDLIEFLRRHGRTAEIGALVEQYREATTRNPEDPVAHFVLARALDAARLPGAEAALRSALELNPRYHFALDFLAGRLDEETIPLLRRALEIYPGFFKTHLDLAQALERNGRIDEAVKEYCAALKYNPRHSSAQERLRRLLSHHDVEAAARELDPLLGRLEEVWNLVGEHSCRGILQTLAVGWMHHGDPERRDPQRALEYARLAVEIGAKPQPLSFGIDMNASRRKPFEQDVEARLLLAEVQASLGNHAGAVLTLEEVAALPHAPGDLREKADEYLRAALPDLPSYGAIDRALEASEREYLVPEGADWRYFKGTEEPPANWKDLDFDDGAWLTGKTGIGYGDDDDETVLEDMKDNYLTVYLRSTFEVKDPEDVVGLNLTIDYDDGFVAYINGNEVARSNVDGVGFDDTARFIHEAGDPESFAVDLPQAALVLGRNLLAIQGFNSQKDSSDFSLIPVLEVRRRPDPEKDRALLEAFRPVASGDDAEDRIAYLDGRRLQRAGKPAEAEKRFAAIVAGEGSRFEPFLRLAESLRASGKSEDAARQLCEAQQHVAVKREKLWDLWARISVEDLGRSPAELIDLLPPESPDSYHVFGDASWDPESRHFVLAGRVFFRVPFPIREWVAEFEVLIREGYGQGMTFAFVRRFDYLLQRSRNASDLDFGGEGYAVEFDTFFDSRVSPEEPPGHHIALVHDRSTRHLVTSLVDEGLEDNVWHSVRVAFKSGRVSVWFDGREVISGYSIPAFEEFTGYFGFTARGVSERHLVRNFRVELPDS